jgi:hypothetical protein
VVRRGGRYAILVTARRDAQLELWAARRRTGLLAELLGSRKSPAPVAVRLDPATGTAGASSRNGTPRKRRRQL